jgi:hypothetical protein
MLGQMPTPQVIALLQAMPAAAAAGVLVAMPADHVEVLLAELPPAALARLLPAVEPDQRADLVAATPAGRLPAMLRALSLDDAAALLGVLDAGEAARLLGALPPEARPQLVSALPEATRRSVYAAMSTTGAGELASAVYERRAVAALARIATVRSRPAPRAAVTDVLGSRLLVHVRPAGPGPLDAEELHELVLAADWSELDAVLVVAEQTPTDRAAAHAGTIRACGYRLELLRWVDDRDDGLLKRALVRVAAQTPTPA